MSLMEGTIYVIYANASHNTNVINIGVTTNYSEIPIMVTNANKVFDYTLTNIEIYCYAPEVGRSGTSMWRDSYQILKYQNMMF